MTRREFLKLTLRATTGVAVGSALYSVAEGRCCLTSRVPVRLPNLPVEFEGLRVAFLADIHHGRMVPLGYIHDIVERVNALDADLVLLGGDYVSHGRQWMAPCMEALGRLRGRLGVYAVLGNHDHYHGAAPAARSELRRNRIVELTNRGVWLEEKGARLRLGGVGDFWRDRQDLPSALGDAGKNDAVLLLSHNPDYVEKIHDPRVGLVLSGHTHGGQCVIPFFGAPILPSRYGQKYRAGLCQGPVAPVYVTRGVGFTGIPLRFACPPEISVLTLLRG